jgi:phosphoglycolate phosphatase
MFDLDGTLIDSKIAILESASRTLKLLKIYSISDNQIIESIGLPIQKLFETKISGDDLSFAVRQFQKDLLETGAKLTQVYPGVKTVLNELSNSGVKMAVVTNKPTRLAKSILYDLGLDSFFHLTVGLDIGRLPKPSGQMLLETMQFFAPLNSAFMVGDRAEDVNAARLAGIKSILIVHADHQIQNSIHAEPDYTLDGLAHLPKLILGSHSGTDQ